MVPSAGNVLASQSNSGKVPLLFLSCRLRRLVNGMVSSGVSLELTLASRSMSGALKIRLDSDQGPELKSVLSTFPGSTC